MIRAGRVALVTGGGRGIGAATARALGRAGARVVVTARTRAQVEAVAADIRAAGGSALAVPADLRDDVEVLRARAEEAFGPVELLVSNAATVAPLGPVWSVEPAEFAASVAANLVGAQALLHTLVPPMLAAGFGRVVAVSSSAARHAVGALGTYSAGKAGFELLHAALALDLAGSPVRVNTLWPGGTDTAMQGDLRAEGSPLAAPARQANDLGRLRQPEDVAEQVLRLLAENLSAHGELVDLGELPGVSGQLPQRP